MRRGLSSIYGFIVLFLFTMASLEASSMAASSLAGLQTAGDRARQLDDLRSLEHLSLTLVNGSVVIANDGLVPSMVEYVQTETANDSSVIPMVRNVPIGTSFSIPYTNSSRVVAITSMGNAFWLDEGQPVSSSPPEVTFDADGVPPQLGGEQVLTVDGKNYTDRKLPLTFGWGAGETHTYEFVDSLFDSGSTRIGLSDTRGLENTPSGQITPTGPGEVVADYATQYLLGLQGGSEVTTSPVSPTGDGWFDEGTSVSASSQNVWDVVANQTRSDLVSWSLDGATPTAIPREDSGIYTPVPVLMDSPHDLAFNSVTQYYVDTEVVPTSISVTPYCIQSGFSAGVCYAASYLTSGISFDSYWNQVLAVYQSCGGVSEPTGANPLTESPPEGVQGVELDSAYNDSTGCWQPVTAYTLSSTPKVGTYSLWFYFLSDGSNCSLQLLGGTLGCDGVGSGWEQGLNLSPGYGTWYELKAVVSAGSATYTVYNTSGGVVASTTNAISFGAAPSEIIKAFADFGADIGLGTVQGPTDVFQGWAPAPLGGSLNVNCLGTDYPYNANCAVVVEGQSLVNPYLSTVSGGDASFLTDIDSFQLPSYADDAAITIDARFATAVYQYGTAAAVPATISDGTITIPSSSISTYGDYFTVLSVKDCASSSISISSPTSDPWFDAGALYPLSGSAGGCLSFSGWSSSPSGAISFASESSATTVATVDSFGSLQMDVQAVY